ncbi:MAG: gamma-glutamylcyclotransferase [Pyrinomonas sp.]|uniref:gamma-glutamylcyclotransferase family protein n=1 Tax=Pyrinomonas sp. TaxID=2080306 RepID=UPI00332C9EC4
MKMLGYLFVYGTLRSECARGAVAELLRRQRLFGPARVRGRLYDLGHYPGAAIDEESATEVCGQIYELTDEQTLAALDAYEGYHPSDERGSLFLRSETVAALDDGRKVPCWIYVYNGDLRNAELIASGDYIEHLRSKLSGGAQR